MEKVGGTVAFIPLRSGSKGIVGKNYKDLAGKPLFCYAVDACIHANSIDRVVIATNSDTIKEITRNRYDQQPKVVLYERSETNAQDESSTEAVMLEFANKHEFDHIVLVQATSPLIVANDIDGGWEKLTEKSLDSLLSVVEEKRFYWEEHEDTQSATPLNYNPITRPRRQEFNGSLVENGAFYITSRKALLESSCRLSGRMGVYQMSQDTAVEIDEPEDFVIIENLIARRGSNLIGNKDKKVSIKLVLTDVDGVLTDSGMYYSEYGDELKRFNTRDGKGFELLRKNGYEVGIITGEDTKLVARRASKLKLDHLFQGADNKLQIISKLVAKLGITLENVAFIGDDINDLELLKAVGLSFCPSDAQEENKQVVDVICKKKGGEGCFREIAEYILKQNAS